MGTSSSPRSLLDEILVILNGKALGLGEDCGEGRAECPLLHENPKKFRHR